MNIYNLNSKVQTYTYNRKSSMSSVLARFSLKPFLFKISSTFFFISNESGTDFLYKKMTLTW